MVLRRIAVKELNTMSTLLFASYSLALVGMPGWAEIAVLLVIGLLIFGKRLPEVGRNLGRSIIEFKKGIKGIDDEIESEADRQIEDTPKAEIPEAKLKPDPEVETDETKSHLDD